MGHEILTKIKQNKHFAVSFLLAFIVCTQSAIAEWWQYSVIDSIPIDYGWHTAVLLVLFCVWCAYRFIRLWGKYVFDTKLVSLLLTYFLLYLFYRFADSESIFNFEALCGDLTYIDVFAFISLAFIFEAVYNRNKIKANDKSNGESILSLDIPINNPVDDKLEYYDSAWTLANYISGLPYNSSQSIAILSPWGNGKSSFMNLIKYAVHCGEKDGKPIMDCILVEFNPRQSKKVDDIQEDFFSVFSETLSKYDSNISSSLNRYLTALGLSIDNPILTFLLKSMSHNVEKSREDINECLLKLPQRVIVFIDDFDRLTAKEMVEVFKLIDKNASFKKVTFVTAFDQGYVESVLGGYFGYGQNTYADKFFTLEYNLPIRPFATLLGMLYDLLRPQTTATKSEEDALRNFMFDHVKLFQLAIKNVRDVKRFYNQFIVDYVAVKNEVILYEYIVVELMKYRYREEFDQLKDHEYLNEPGLFGSHGFYTLKEECKNDKGIKALPLLEYLFAYSIDHLDVPKNYMSIKRVNKFDTYFRNKLYGQIPDKDFLILYSLSTEEILSKFDIWLSMNLKGNIIDYVTYQDWQCFIDANGLPDWQKFSKYVEIAILLAYKTKGDDFNLRVLISRMLYKPNLEECNYYGKTEGDYRNFMIESLYDDFSRVPIEVIAEITMQMARKPQNTDEQQHIERQVIGLTTYQAKNIEYLKWYIDQHKEFTLDALRIYQMCIKEILANDKIVILDEANTIMREYIENDTECIYLKNFIRYYIQDNVQYIPIQCEPFCKQIFSVTEDKDLFAEYVAKAAIDDELRHNILTYWAIYKIKPYNENPLYKYTKGTNPTLTEIVQALEEENKAKKQKTN